MIAVDTNVLVRLFVADDELQAARAARLLETAERVFVSKTVVLEFAWVLSAAYATPRAGLVSALQTLAGLRELDLEDRPQVERAIALYSEGLDDFTDALHLASSERAEAFVTFDRKLISKARKRGGPLGVRAP